MPQLEPSANPRLTDLINGGDWACSFGDCDGLEQVYRQLAENLDGALAERAHKLAQWIDVDPNRAFEGWTDLVADLRTLPLRH